MALVQNPRVVSLRRASYNSGCAPNLNMIPCEKHMMETLGPPDINCHSPRHLVGVRRGIQLSFILLEPVVYLQGHSTPSGACKNKPAVLRGYLHLKVTEPTKIRRICVSFRGLVQLELSGVESAGKKDLITSGITYFDRGPTACSDNAYGADCYHLSDQSLTAIESGQHVKNSAQAWWSDQLPPPEYRIDSLDQSGLLDAVSEGSRQPINSRRKGHHGLFPAGDYTYSFEFLVHDSLPETINTDLISTRYYLEVMIESPGPFHSKMRSQLDIPLIRLPSENSLELIEPIISSKDWRDQLHYDVCIFGRSFRLGSRIPMRVKLTPLVNLECRWIRVYVSQHVQHWTMGREPRRLQLPTKKVLLFEKQAGLASYSTYPGSRMRITTDKGMIRPPVMQKGNLLGQILETSEIELEVQLPRCPEMKVREKRQWLQLSTKGGRPDVNHWIQIVLCLSTKDENAMGPSKPRAVELIIESPFTILSCKATPANIYVPPYAVGRDMADTPLHKCQCDCGGGARSITLASRNEAAVSETEASTSAKPLCPGDITRPLNFDSGSSDIKPPAQVHLPDWDIPEILPSGAPYGVRSQWHAR